MQNIRDKQNIDEAKGALGHLALISNGMLSIQPKFYSLTNSKI